MRVLASSTAKSGHLLRLGVKKDEKDSEPGRPVAQAAAGPRKADSDSAAKIVNKFSSSSPYGSLDWLGRSRARLEVAQRQRRAEAEARAYARRTAAARVSLSL